MWVECSLTVRSYFEVTICALFSIKFFAHFFCFRYLTWTKLKLLRFALSLRTHSPKIEMFQQVAIEHGVDQLGCDAVVEYRGKLTCNLPEIVVTPDDIHTDGSHVFSVDHVHPHSVREMELVVLYADVESENFGKYHSKILDFVKLGRVTYVFRHFLPNRSAQKVRMSGKNFCLRRSGVKDISLHNKVSH